MRFPNKKYQIPDGRELTITLLSDPVNHSTIFRLEYDGAAVVSFGITGLQFEEMKQQSIAEDEFVLDNIRYTWAEDWLIENKLAEPTGEHRTWLKDSKYSFDTTNLQNWEDSANPNFGIQRHDYPVYKVIMSTITQGQ